MASPKKAKNGVDFIMLKKAIKSINPLLPEKIKIVGFTKEVLIKKFIAAINSLNSEGRVDDIPDVSFDFYNEQFAGLAENEVKKVVGEDDPAKEASNKPVNEPTPKSKAEGKIATKTSRKRDLFGNPSATTRVAMIICESDNFSVTLDEVIEKLKEEGYKHALTSTATQYGDTFKTIAYLQKIGKLPLNKE